MSSAANVRWYIPYIALTRAYFWYAIFFLYFQSKFTTSQVLLLEAIYYVSVVVMEVPSGYFSDKFGRVNALRISALSFLASYLTFAIADPFWLFALAQILFASGFAFASGSDTSFLYGSLLGENRDDEFAEFESRVASVGSFVSAGAAIVGGILGTYALFYGHLASAVVAGCALLITVAIFREPTHDTDPDDLRFFDNLRDVVRAARRPDLAWLFLAVVSMLVLIHIPYEYYQPYISGLPALSQNEIEPTVVTGLHAAIALLVASIFARLSARISERLGVVMTVLLALGTIVLIVAAMAWTNAWWVAILLVFRSAPGAFLSPILNATIVPRIADRIRATYLSVQSLAGRLSFALVLAVFAAISDRVDGALSPMLWAGVAIGCGLLLLLGVTARFARPERE